MPASGWQRGAVGCVCFGICIALAAAGCSVKRVPVKDPQATAPPSTSYDPQAEAASPPPPEVAPAPASAAEPTPTLDVPDPVALEAAPVEVQDLPASSAPVADPAQSGSTPPAARPLGGAYHVQVFASTDRDAAERMRREVESRTGIAAEVVFEAPHYKVRAGECPTSDACRELQRRLQASGYDTVWIVSGAAP
jgi:hypothetical protein